MCFWRITSDSSRELHTVLYELEKVLLSYPRRESVALAIEFIFAMHDQFREVVLAALDNDSIDIWSSKILIVDQDSGHIVVTQVTNREI